VVHAWSVRTFRAVVARWLDGLKDDLWEGSSWELHWALHAVAAADEELFSSAGARVLRDCVDVVAGRGWRLTTRRTSAERLYRFERVRPADARASTEGRKDDRSRRHA
jgi:hypothetical protein